MAQAILAGLRVLDFGRFIAAPSCAAILADLGAEVIRVERRGGGEDRWLGPLGDGCEGGMFLQNNRNKRSITLDPMAAEGAEVVKRLVGSADIVVANLPDVVMKKMNIDYEKLRAIKPDVILTLVSAYGRGGPYSNRLGFDAVGQVMSGAVRRSGWPDQPVRSPVPYVDFGTGLAAAVGTLAAVMHRQATGEGQQVEVSLLSTALTMTSAMLIEQAVIKPNRVATLNRGQLSAPNNIYATKGGFILVQAVGQPIFARWAALMGGEQWLADSRFSDDKKRGENWEVIDARMAEWCCERSNAEALAELETARVPAYPVNTIQEALDDPHVQAMGYLVPTEYPGAPAFAPIAETPFRLSKSAVAPTRRAPTVGEHTDEVLAEIGYSTAEIAALRERRII
jgi:crotonobetainyl-CoA:carnitine CoA-transferase CaiB-like acyl-CoA transferase